MEYLAKPAPNVDDEPILVEDAPQVEAATAEAAIPDERVVVEDAPVVKPAVAGRENDETSPSPPLTQPRSQDKHTKYSNGGKNSHPLSVKSLRGGAGADFASVAAVVARPGSRTWYQRWFPMVFEERNFLSFGEAEKFVLVKGGCCFIFPDDLSVSPLYAIPLGKVVPVLENRYKPHPKSITISPEGVKNLSSESLRTVLLMHGSTIEYQISFRAGSNQSDVDDVARKFMDFVSCEMEPQGITEEKAILLAEVDIFLSSQKKKG